MFKSKTFRREVSFVHTEPPHTTSTNFAYIVLANEKSRRMILCVFDCTCSAENANVSLYS